MGIKVICTKDNDVLKLETKGQLFILEALGDDKFKIWKEQIESTMRRGGGGGRGGNRS